MRITKLTLKDFRSHSEVVLELDRFNFIRGPNGCGKTSIQLALEYLFTGRCQMTDAAGRGAETLIRAGAKELEVSATFEGGEAICRRRGSRSHIFEMNGNRVPVETAGTLLEKRFGSTDILAAVLHAGRFVEMAEAEQQELLAQVLDGGRLDIPQEIVAVLRVLREEPPSLACVADVGTAYRRFYDLRTEMSRSLKALGRVEEPEIAPDLPSVEEVKKKIEELRNQKEQLIAQRAGASGSWEGAQTRLKEIEIETEALAPEILSSEEEQELLELESRRNEAERVRQELSELGAKQTALEMSLAAVAELQDKCPTCGQRISGDVKAKELDVLRERLGDTEGLIQGAKEELSEYAGIETATARLENHRNAVARRGTLNKDGATLRIVQKTNDADLDSRMKILVERINKAERVLEKARDAEALRERWKTYVTETSALAKTIALLDKLIEFFGPTGAMMVQSIDRIGSFTESLNRHLAGFGYACCFTFDPFEVRVTLPTGDGATTLRLKQLSESERLRFGIAFQIALSVATGIRLVVIDRADMLDKERRRSFTGLLLQSDVDQAIVLATGEELPPSFTPPGVNFVDLTRVKKSAHEQEAEPTSEPVLQSEFQPPQS